MQSLDFRQLWTVVLCFLLAIVAALWFNGVRFHAGPWGTLYAICSAGCILGNGMEIRSPEWFGRLLVFANGYFLLVTICMSGALTSYLIARVTTAPFADPWLYQADLMMGLDWRRVYSAYVEYDSAHFFMRRCYDSLTYSPAIVLCALALSGRKNELITFLLAFALALGVTMLIFVFIQAEATAAFLLGPNPEYLPRSGNIASWTISNLRSGALADISVHTLVGLVTFPSFHSAASVLIAWAAWPVRLIRVPLLIVNAGMLMATPIEGTHYFVDVIAGVLIAAGAIYAVRAWRHSAGRIRRVRVLRPVLQAE